MNILRIHHVLSAGFNARELFGVYTHVTVKVVALNRRFFQFFSLANSSGAFLRSGRM